MNSIKDALGKCPHGVTAEIALILRSHFPDNKLLVVVEGASDKKVYSRFYDSSKFDVYCSTKYSGCLDLPDMLRALNAKYLSRLIAIKDADFDHLNGVGYGGSIQKLAYLPECHTDFIFAILAEELGFIGCVLVIGLFWTLVHRGFIIASRCPDLYGRLLAVGITFAIGFQAFLNISVASSFLPTTGVPLPFISYGGSSLIVSLWMVGILLNISKKRIKKIRNQDEERARERR